MTSFIGSHLFCAAENFSAVTLPVESSFSPPKEITSPLPRIVADGYQCPPFMSFVLVYVSVAGSKVYESFSPW